MTGILVISIMTGIPVISVGMVRARPEGRGPVMAKVHRVGVEYPFPNLHCVARGELCSPREPCGKALGALVAPSIGGGHSVQASQARERCQ